jgi:hypothetical protein
MAEIRNYTMNFGSDITCRGQVSLRRNKPLKRRVVGHGYDLLRPEIHG